MKQIWVAITVALLSAAFLSGPAEAARLGGGKSIGMQRNFVNRQAAAPTPPTAAQAAPAKPAAAAPTGMSRWLGPLAGLAAGGLLAALFMNGAFEGLKFMDIAILMLLAGGALIAFRMLRARSVPAQTPAPGNLAMQSAGTGTGGVSSSLNNSAFGAAPAGVAAQPRYPAGFAVDPFLQQAKSAFIRLQAVNDANNLAELRDFTTPELFAELARDIEARGNAPQKTEIVTLTADLIEVVTEDQTATASVRFKGLIREQSDAVAEPFDEVWHVTKRLDDATATWVVAGIQQLQ
jgi:predicted lipid-binding transport protein (Tim44 family)